MTATYLLPSTAAARLGLIIEIIVIEWLLFTHFSVSDISET